MSKIAVIITILLVGVIMILGITKKQIIEPKTEINKETSMKIESPAFKNNGMIPSKYTCDGNNINPQLNIFNVPETAKSLALIVEDPDAQIGTFTHWIVWNIDPATKEISENSNAGGAEGKNDFKRSSYDGPCPNSGTHRYVFKLFALDTTLTLPANSDKKSLEAAMNGHVISSVDVVGLYSRK